MNDAGKIFFVILVFSYFFPEKDKQVARQAVLIGQLEKRVRGLQENPRSPSPQEKGQLVQVLDALNAELISKEEKIRILQSELATAKTALATRSRVQQADPLPVDSEKDAKIAQLTDQEHSHIHTLMITSV